MSTDRDFRMKNGQRLPMASAGKAVNPSLQLTRQVGNAC